MPGMVFINPDDRLLKHESRAVSTPQILDSTVSTVIEAEMVEPGLAGLWDNILKIR